MSYDWVKVFSTNFVYMAELVKGQLEGDNIKTFLLNKQDSMHNQMFAGEIEPYVDRDNVLKAKHLISKLEE